jgi:uncharacterized membrane protein (UPF0136 family)
MTLYDRRDPAWSGVVVGLTILGLGIILLFDQTGFFGWRTSWSIWPFLIIALGLARFAQLRPDGSRDGGWLLFAGGLLLLNETRMLRFRDSWPLILVALGVLKMWMALRPTRIIRPHGQSS